MLLSVLQQAATSSDQLGIEDPRVLGPLAAFVFAVFVFEIVAPGKAYKRLQVENEKMREMLAKVLPVSEEMLAISKQMMAVMQANTDMQRSFLQWAASWSAEIRGGSH